MRSLQRSVFGSSKPGSAWYLPFTVTACRESGPGPGQQSRVSSLLVGSAADAGKRGQFVVGDFPVLPFPQVKTSHLERKRFNQLTGYLPVVAHFGNLSATTGAKWRALKQAGIE